MITIEQLLESVDLDFEPRWVTKDKIGTVCLWKTKPSRLENLWGNNTDEMHSVDFLILSEFHNKPWQDCVYEVPRKATGNENEQKMLAELERKLNAIVDAAIDAINELKGAKNE